MSVTAIFGSNFSTAFISIDGQSSFLLFDEADAEALETCVQYLQGKPPGTRIDFYRDLLDNHPLRGAEGLLMKIIEP